MIKKNDFNRYFFNNLYDDKLIQEKQTDFQNRLYRTILDGKEWIQNNRIINGHIEYIEVNQDLNLKLGVPLNTYSLQLTENIIPFYSEKLFFEKYGFGNVISSLDILRDTSVFSKTFYFFVNNYLIYDTKIVFWKDRCTILIIPESDERRSNLSAKDFEELLLEQDADCWTIMLGTKADFFISPLMERTRLIKDGKIRIEKFNERKVFNKPVTNNYWTMYITGRFNSYNAMIAVNTTLEEDKQGQFFAVPMEFLKFLSIKGSVHRVLVVNEPECGGTGIYVDSEGTQPIFQIPFKKNPIPKRNLLIWAYDAEKKRKLHPIEASVDLYYPNIYDFTEMIDEAYCQTLYTKSRKLVKDASIRNIVFNFYTKGDKQYDLYIEWIEPMEDCSAYDSYIQDYMEAHRLEWANMIYNNDLPPYICDFHPILTDPHVSALDYFKSDFYGDYRAWKLDNLVRLMLDNPKRYDELYHMIYYKAKMYITRTYNYNSEPHIYTKRNIMDNKEHCESYEEVLMLFDEPQTYLQIYDYHDITKPVSLFFNGLFHKKTYSLKYGSSMFIYFDKALIENKETIQLDIELVDEDIYSKPFNFPSFDSKVDLGELGFPRKVSLSNIIFIDEDGNYLPKEDFKYEGKVDISEIEYIGGNETDFLSHASGDLVLYDKDEDLYVPTEHDYVVLKTYTKRFEIDDPEAVKNIDPSELVISLKPGNSFQYLGKTFRVVTTDFFESKEIQFSPEYIREHGYTYEYPNFKGNPSKGRFRIYLNGYRLNPLDFEVEFSKYNQSAFFTFVPELVTGVLTIQYCGWDEIVLYNGKIGDLRRTWDEILYLKDVLLTPFDTIAHKIFIDGVRISDDQIHIVGDGNMLMIKETYYEFSDNSTMVIYQQKNDDDPYEYNGNVPFLTNVAIDDENFREYLIQKY